jgi:hypothetical protein
MHGNLLESWCTPKLRLGSIDLFIHIKGQSSSLFIIFAGYEDDVIMISLLHLIQILITCSVKKEKTMTVMKVMSDEGDFHFLTTLANTQQARLFSQHPSNKYFKKRTTEISMNEV